MIEYVKGNILDAKEFIICQQVNCQGVMGSGLAKAIKDKYPEVYEEYNCFCEQFTPEELLGLVLTVYTNKYDHIIANIFGQLNFGRDGKQYTNYSALEKAFDRLEQQLSVCDNKNYSSLAFPYKFGCGLGGGNWNTVLPLIEKCFSNRKIVIYQI